MKQIDNQILKEVKGVFKRLGFEQEDKDLLSFNKSLESGFEQIEIVTTYWAGECQGFFLLTKRINAVECRLWKYREEIKIRSFKDNSDVTVFSMKFMDSAITGKLNDVHHYPLIVVLKALPLFVNWLQIQLRLKPFLWPNSLIASLT